jgi:hypothetical protein
MYIGVVFRKWYDIIRYHFIYRLKCLDIDNFTTPATLTVFYVIGMEAKVIFLQKYFICLPT